MSYLHNQGDATVGQYAVGHPHMVKLIEKKGVVIFVMNHGIVSVVLSIMCSCCVVVNKLRFEPPLKKETEACSEMVSTQTL